MFTYTVFDSEGAQVARFADQHNDFKAFAYVLDHQSSSFNTALKHQGWKVTVTDQSTGQTIDYLTGKQIL